MKLPNKEQSEVLKNLVAAAALIVGGGWTLYQWNTIFPKQDADVKQAASTVRTDVSGSFELSTGGMGLLEVSDEGESGGSNGVGNLYFYCSENPRSPLTAKIPFFGTLNLKSASKIPVMARIDTIEVSKLAVTKVQFSAQSVTDPSASALPSTVVATLDDDDVFLGGLRENRVEAGQEIKAAMAFETTIPIGCSPFTNMLLVQANISLRPIDPVSGDIGDSVNKVFVSNCQIAHYGEIECNVDGPEALGQ
ncbi:hypothetical protein [Qipengyuania vesicularis]|uniref:hypothetical protein n=1 Tax=Qipengyuania vesicularis TaxID=2867232 RepID=UPI001C881A75|nr:hypothetical protein [Qipengyuania vesicularis]MBX7526565.1 hypothetical protein [Qipengyuania vesicularis]